MTMIIGYHAPHFCGTSTWEEKDDAAVEMRRRRSLRLHTNYHKLFSSPTYLPIICQHIHKSFSSATYSQNIRLQHIHKLFSSSTYSQNTFVCNIFTKYFRLQHIHKLFSSATYSQIIFVCNIFTNFLTKYFSILIWPEQELCLTFSMSLTD